MAMAAARRAGGLEWLSGAAEDYGQTPTFTLPSLLKECELNAAAGLVIDIETTRPRLLKLIDDFEKEACSQHEAKDPSWTTELSGILAGRRTELPFFRHALETDPWRDLELEIHGLRNVQPAALAAGGGGPRPRSSPSPAAAPRRASGPGGGSTGPGRRRRRRACWRRRCGRGRGAPRADRGSGDTAGTSAIPVRNPGQVRPHDLL